jgi:hypothetical protein
LIQQHVPRRARANGLNRIRAILFAPQNRFGLTQAVLFVYAQSR